jgi:glycerophosphoryl diester phosphodiesterase
MAAFRRAVELGALFIETDLHLSRDARLVAIHDSTLERTSNGHGRVSDHTLAELQQLDAGSWFDRDFSGERIPTLEEILALARGADVVLYLEIKYEEAWGMHHSLLAALRKDGDLARTTILSFEPATLEALRRLDKTVMTGLLVETTQPDGVDLALGVGARQLCPRGDLVASELIEKAHQADLQVATWTLNQPEQMRAAIAAGIDGIMTDYPDRLRAVIEDSRVGSR